MKYAITYKKIISSVLCFRVIYCSKGDEIGGAGVGGRGSAASSLDKALRLTDSPPLK